MKDHGIDVKTDSTSGRLNEIWQRLDLVCRKLWDEDSSAAVGLQAVIEEFKGEVHRVEQMLISYQKTLYEQRQAMAKEYEGIYNDRIRAIEHQLAHGNERIAIMEDGLFKKEAKIKDLLNE